MLYYILLGVSNGYNHANTNSVTSTALPRTDVPSTAAKPTSAGRLSRAPVVNHVSHPLGHESAVP